MKKAVILVMFAFAMIIFAGCGGDPCKKLVQHYCEVKKDQAACNQYTKQVNEGMSKEACKSTYKMAK
ncbi:MAG: hypothetical protein FJ088_03265 [Deltaproteobacteria bacterium]|nr:hypothetical protein [Deltaproteobacteria bacterium]